MKEKKNKFYTPAGKKVCVTLKTLNGNEVRSQLGEHTALFITLRTGKRVSVFPQWKREQTFWSSRVEAWRGQHCWGSLDLTFLTSIYSCELTSFSEPFSLKPSSFLVITYLCASLCIVCQKSGFVGFKHIMQFVPQICGATIPSFLPFVSHRALAFCFDPGNAFSSPISSVSHERCLSWSQLPSRFTTVSIVIMAPITQQKWPYGTSMSLQGNVYRFPLIIYCIVCQWPHSELCILLDNQRSCHTQCP